MIIIEGLDGVGKTTLVDFFVEQGMKKHHFEYDENNMDLFTKYMNILKNNNTKKLVLDRSFISEMVYGPVLRNSCKLTLEQYKELLLLYKRFGTLIIYLTSPKEVLLKRRVNDIKDYEMIDRYYEKLNNRYNEIMNYSSKIITVGKYDSYELSKEEIQGRAKRLILK